MVRNDLKRLSQEFDAAVDDVAFDQYAARRKTTPKKFPNLTDEARIYPNYWASVVVAEQGRRLIRPMRYRVIPSGSEQEVPAKYNLFNARLDQLTRRKTWSSLLGRHHGIIVARKFYEWVEDSSSSKKHVISFAPRGVDAMIIPVLFDEWVGGQDVIRSFAVITTEPTSEILAAGHDRCPVFLKQKNIELWLQPTSTPATKILEALQDVEHAFYEHESTVG